MSGSCACFTSVYIQNPFAAHACAVAWRLVCTSCRPSLTSYGISCLLTFLYGLLLLWGWALFNCGLFFLQPTLLLLFAVLHFLLHYSAIPAMMLFDLSLLGLFGSAVYSSLDDSIWSLGLLLHGLWTLASHFFPLGCPWPIYFPWASSALSNSASPWAFTNSFRLSQPNYFILHPWGSWAHHQPLTFFTCITSGLLWPILTLLHDILPMGLLLLSFWAPLGLFASSMPICLFYRSMIHYSYLLGLMVFLSTY